MLEKAGHVTESGSYITQPEIDQVGDRYERFSEIRAGGPVIRKDGFVLTTTRAAAEEVFQNPKRFSSKGGSIGNPRPMIPIQYDPPEQRFYRRLLDPLFAPRAINHLNDQITQIVNTKIDAFIDRGWCRFDEEFAVPVPTEVFLGLMGLPMSDAPTLLKMKDGILRPGFREGVTEPDAVLAIQDRTGKEVYDYFQVAIEERRGRDGNDMLTSMMTASVEGKTMTTEEVLDACFLMLIAGLDTITNSLTLFYMQFTQRPDLRQQIVDNPAVIASAVEELLRWETPTPAVVRFVVEETDNIAGCPVHRGETISVDLGMADTDPDYWADADQIRFDRAINPHYAFSGGVHRCSGSYLARQELRIVLGEWHRRIPDYWLQEGHEPVWPPGLRSVENMYLEWKR